MAELVWVGKHYPHSVQSIDGQKPPNSYQLFTDSHYTPSSSGPVTPPPIPCENWVNRLIFGDRHEALCALLADFSASVDLIYIDPPFMTGRTFNYGAELAYSDVWHDGLD